MIPYLIAALGGYLIGSSLKSEYFEDGGTMWRVKPSTMAEDMNEAKALLGEEKWNSFTESEKDNVVQYLKSQGKIGLPGQEEDIEGISALQYYDKGGNVKYYDKDNEYRLGRPSGSIDKEVLEKVKYYSESGNFVGNFGWKTPQNKLADGYLYTPDEDLVKNIKLKQGEKIFIYFNYTTAIGGMAPLIKINIEKGLLYFLKSEDSEVDSEVVFDTKGVKALWISLIKHKL